MHNKPTPQYSRYQHIKWVLAYLAMQLLIAGKGWEKNSLEHTFSLTRETSHLSKSNKKCMANHHKILDSWWWHKNIQKTLHYLALHFLVPGIYKYLCQAYINRLLNLFLWLIVFTPEPTELAKLKLQNCRLKQRMDKAKIKARILQELKTTKTIPNRVNERKMKYFGHVSETRWMDELIRLYVPFNL